MKAAGNALLGSVIGIIALALAVGIILTAFNVFAWAQDQRTFYDRDGRIVGRSTTTKTGTTTLYDRDGRVAGRAFVTGSGETILYDRDGRRAGSIQRKETR